MLKKGIVILIVLCSVDFFTLIFIPELVQKAADIPGIGLIGAFLLLMLFYDSTPGIPRRFNTPIVLMLLAMSQETLLE